MRQGHGITQSHHQCMMWITILHILGFKSVDLLIISHMIKIHMYDIYNLCTYIMYICTRSYIYIYTMYKYSWIQKIDKLYIYIYITIQLYMHVCVHTYAYTYTYTSTYIHIYIYINPHTWSSHQNQSTRPVVGWPHIDHRKRRRMGFSHHEE